MHPGESIQAAIDAAQPGDKIKIRAGTYHENVYVNKDFIELLEDMKIEGFANGAFLVNTEDGGDYHDSGEPRPPCLIGD